MRTVLWGAAALIAVAACSSVPKVETDPGTGRVDVDVENPGRPETWTANLAAMSGSNVTGTSTAVVSDDMTHATIRIRGGGSGGTHPWHIHEGSCGDASAPVVGPASAYPPLRPGADGAASAEAHLADIELNEARRYHVNVHQSPAAMGTIISCGNLDD
jgi:hypothetical protein